MKKVLANLANPEYFQENRLPAHSDHKYFANVAELVSGDSRFYLSLSGLWHFAFAPNLNFIPQNCSYSNGKFRQAALHKYHLPF